MSVIAAMVGPHSLVSPCSVWFTTAEVPDFSSDSNLADQVSPLLPTADQPLDILWHEQSAHWCTLDNARWVAHKQKVSLTGVCAGFMYSGEHCVMQYESR